ncbi:zinc finger, CCHC-type containing protein [Tanacetum coccineum]
MASQDARLFKFEANFKQQQSKMNNKIDTVLKAITGRITGALRRDTVKNQKLNVNFTSPVLSAHSYPTNDPQSSSNTLNSVNAIKTCSKETNHSQKDQSLELRKNRSAFIQGKMPEKIEDPGLFTLSCRLGDSKPFDTLADLEVHMGKLKFINDFYVIDMEKDPTTPLLVGRGFLETANVVIDYRKDKIAVEERITRSIFRVKGIDLGE